VNAGLSFLKAWPRLLEPGLAPNPFSIRENGPKPGSIAPAMDQQIKTAELMVYSVLTANEALPTKFWILLKVAGLG
jgi:hypothetical protein